MARLPTGTVTFLFSDIECSTRLWDCARGLLRVGCQPLRAAVGDRKWRPDASLPGNEGPRARQPSCLLSCMPRSASLSPGRSLQVATTTTQPTCGQVSAPYCARWLLGMERRSEPSRTNGVEAEVLDASSVEPEVLRAAALACPTHCDHRPSNGRPGRLGDRRAARPRPLVRRPRRRGVSLALRSVRVDPLADTQDVAVGVADVHLAHVPGLVLGRADHVEAVALAGGVDLVDVVDPE
jgi:hypothetical protein